MKHPGRAQIPNAAIIKKHLQDNAAFEGNLGKKTNTAFTLALLTVPARFGSDQHGSVRQCKRVQTVPCRPSTHPLTRAGTARHGCSGQCKR